jgi:hypothetical protein
MIFGRYTAMFYQNKLKQRYSSCNIYYTGKTEMWSENVGCFQMSLSNATTLRG